jgi:hypothetical protein
MTGYFSWLADYDGLAERAREAWPATTKALPIGAHATGEVIARHPFGVFVRINGIPDALGLAEITSMPREAPLPDLGTAVAGEVIWHAEHNHQVKLRLLDGQPPRTDNPRQHPATIATTSGSPNRPEAG